MTVKGELERQLMAAFAALGERERLLLLRVAHAFARDHGDARGDVQRSTAELPPRLRRS